MGCEMSPLMKIVLKFAGAIPQLMAALRHTGIGLLRAAGYHNIAKACRQMAGQPQRALALIGIEMEN